jgi:hypothetical protein
MIDDEARGWAEAVRSQALAVAVACKHEDVHRLGGGDHLPLDAPASRLAPGWSAKARFGLGE